MRDQSCIVEPQERPDPYAGWTKSTDPLQRELSDLAALREPGKLADRIRKLLKDGVPRKSPWQVQVWVLLEALPLAPRVGEDFTVELLELMPGVLANTPDHEPGQEPPYPRAPAELLFRGFFFAGHYDHRDLVHKIADAFVNLVRTKPEETRLRLVNVVAGQCLLTLKKLGLRDEIDRFLTLLQAEVPGGAPTAEMRPKHVRELESWAVGLQTLLHLAAGYLMFGLNDRASSILDAARQELLTPHTIRLDSKDYVELARAYVQALGHAPAEDGLARLIELFREMPRDRITNTWATAQYYSRFHLNFVEDVVFALCRPATEPHVVSA